MFFTRKAFNPKRQLRHVPPTSEEQKHLLRLAEQVQYGGNSEHKKTPGDFGLNPPSSPRLGKTLCDDAGVFKKAEAIALLREGLRHGLVSMAETQDWPKNIWAVSAEGVPFEAQRENHGVYHGYPMPENDPFRDEVLRTWTIATTI